MLGLDCDWGPSNGSKALTVRPRCLRLSGEGQAAERQIAPGGEHRQVTAVLVKPGGGEEFVIHNFQGELLLHNRHNIFMHQHLERSL